MCWNGLAGKQQYLELFNWSYVHCFCNHFMEIVVEIIVLATGTSCGYLIFTMYYTITYYSRMALCCMWVMMTANQNPYKLTPIMQT